MALALSIRIDADGKAAIVETRKVSDAVDRVGKAGARSGKEAAEVFKRVETGASAATRSVGRLFAAFASFTTLRAFSRTADDIANINARLQVVTKTQERYTVAQQQTFAVAQRTSSSLESTATLYGRLQRAVDDLGGSQRQALELTETINQAFAVSGATAAESSNAIIQFAQGLSAGALRGDEFNSVMEQAPRLAEALSASLGVTRGQLREMAKDGQLTASTIINALQSQSAAIAEEFEKIPLTVERAWVRVKNAVLLAAGEIEKAGGANQSFAEFLDAIATQLPQITQSAIAFASTVVDQWSAAFSRAGDAAGGFFGDLQRNAGLVIPALTQTIIDGLAVLPANIRLIVAQAGALFDEMSAAVQIAFAELRAGASQALLALEGVASEVAGKVAVVFGEVFDAVIRRFGELTASIATGLDFVGLDEQAEGMRNLADSLKEAAQFEETYAREAKERAEAIKRASEETEQARQTEVRALLNQIDASEDSVRAFEQERAEALRLLQERRKLTDVTVELDEATGDLSDTVEDDTEATNRNKRAQEELRIARREQAQQARELENVTRDLYGLDRELSEYFGGPAMAAANRYADAINLINAAEQMQLSLGPMSQQQVQELQRLRTLASDRLSKEQARIAYEADETAQRVDAAWQNASDSIGAAIGDFATGGIESFEDFADAVKDIARRLVSDLISTFAQNLFSGQGGNLAGLFGGGGGGGGFNLTSLFGGAGGSGGILGGLFGGGAGAASSAAAVGGANAAAAGFTVPGTAAASGSSGFGALGGAAGIAAIVAVAMMVNDSLYGQGWRATRSSTTLPNGQVVTGGGSTIAREVQRSFDPLGVLPDRWGSILSGSATVARLFGRSAPRLTDGETTFRFGPDGATGGERYRTLERGGVFRSDRRRWHASGLGAENQAFGDDIFAGLRSQIDASLEMLGSDAEVNFAASMRVIQKFNKKGEVTATEMFVDVLGRSFKVASEDEAIARLGAEAVIASIDASRGGVVESVEAALSAADDAIIRSGGSIGRDMGERFSIKLAEGAGQAIEDTPGEVFQSTRGEASAIAERWRHDTQLLVEGAQFLLSAAADANAGFALLGPGSTLTEIADLTEDLNASGETLLQTYQRMVLSTKLLDDALALSGVSLNKTREEVIRLATDIAEAAGGLDRASQLWAAYFTEFFTEQERAQLQLDQANAARATALSQIALDAEISNDAFRAAFEAALPTLDADQIVQWLEAGAAIAAANAAQAAYNATLTETAEVITEVASLSDEHVSALERHREALRAARDEYASFAAGLRREVGRIGLNEFQLEMRDIAEWTKENVQQLNELARAAGYAAASEADLGLVHQIAAARAAEAIARLTNSARSLVAQLFGGDSGQTLIDDAQTYVDNSIAGIEQIGAASDQLYQSQLAGIQSIQAYLDAQLLGDTSSLTPAEQLAEARRQFEEAFQRALGGDVDALNDITRLADILLRQGQAFDPSDYPELEAFVRGMLGQLANIVPVGGGGPGGTDPNVIVGGGGSVGGVIGQVLDGSAEQVAADRAALVAELVNMVRDLMDATGQSLTEVAASIGLNVQDFIQELGINLDDLTVETTLQLAALSGQLGTSLTDLAQQVGFDLGGLADSQSLLNQALGATIEGLPNEDRRVLQPLFDNIANATTAADANAAIDELTAATNLIGGSTVAALAPYLPGVVIQTELGTANGHLSTLTTIGADSLLELQNIVNELRGTGSGGGLPGPGGGGGGGGLPGPGLPGATTAGFGEVTTLLTGIISRLDRVEAATVTAGGNTVHAITGEQARKTRDAERARDSALAGRRA